MAKNQKESSGIESKAIKESQGSKVEFIQEPVLEALRPAGFQRKYILDKWTYQLPTGTIQPAEIKETHTADVIIIGAGTSGKAAALTAAKAGAKVIQIDRHTTFRYSGGIIAGIDSRLQKKLGIVIDKDEAILALMKAGGNMPNQKFYRLWADNSGAILDWILDLTEPEGITTNIYQWPRSSIYNNKTEYYEDFPVGHWQTDGTSTVLNHSLSLKQFEKQAIKLGAEIHYQTRALQLIRQAYNGRVTGVIAMDKNRRFIQYNARKAVIVSTGDYGNNPQFLQKHAPYALDIALEENIYMTRNEDLRVAPEPLNTGDGHQMVMRIGGVMESSPPAPMSHGTIGPLNNNAFLHVNILGERYENEDVSANAIANSLGQQPGNKAWQVFDSRWEEQIPISGVGLGKFVTVTDLAKDNVKNLTVKADSIEELARQMEVPVKTFKATIERYNYICKLGKDLDFSKQADRMFPVDKPPFYAGKSKREFLIILGGLNTNMRLQPLDKDNKIIPGIYLSGNMVGNRFAIDYPVMCAGISHCLAYLTGRMAGQFAAAEQA
jgi:fumarate reductase flavoprotein subunit